MEESDEALARRLQEQEFLASRGGNTSTSSGASAASLNNAYSNGYLQPFTSFISSGGASRYDRIATDDHSTLE
jgi:hypothetical protein